MISISSILLKKLFEIIIWYMQTDDKDESIEIFQLGNDTCLYRDELQNSRKLFFKEGNRNKKQNSLTNN